MDLRGRTILLAAEWAKNKQAQTLPLAPALQEVLARRAEHRRRDCLLVFHVNGRPMHHGGQKVRTRACEAAGLRGKRLHDCRRSVSRDLVGVAWRQRPPCD